IDKVLINVFHSINSCRSNVIVKIMACNERPIDYEEVIKLYRNSELLEERVFQDKEDKLNKVLTLGAWKDESLIGLVRAVSDGNSRAYIEDIVIHSLYRKEGLGIKLVSTVLKELSCNHFILRRKYNTLL
ncbi:GNAT family N-acetyltransferase, partial [Streptomyces griseus]|uniref:GNAT family N-acetyltransferase n=2 Tax=Bacteria TaxID=2 RepID=UPI003453F33C